MGERLGNWNIFSGWVKGRPKACHNATTPPLGRFHEDLANMAVSSASPSPTNLPTSPANNPIYLIQFYRYIYIYIGYNYIYI